MAKCVTVRGYYYYYYYYYYLKSSQNIPKLNKRVRVSLDG